jgi:hypothetical protein
MNTPLQNAIKSYGFDSSPGGIRPLGFAKVQALITKSWDLNPFGFESRRAYSRMEKSQAKGIERKLDEELKRKRILMAYPSSSFLASADVELVLWTRI